MNITFSEYRDSWSKDTQHKLNILLDLLLENQRNIDGGKIDEDTFNKNNKKIFKETDLETLNVYANIAIIYDNLKKITN